MHVRHLNERRDLVLICVFVVVLLIAACGGSEDATTEDLVTASSSSAPTTIPVASSTTPPTSSPVTTTTARTTTSTSSVPEASQVIVTIDEATLRVEPGEVVVGPPGGFQLLVVNDTTEPQQVVFVSIIAGSPDDLPVVEGLVDVSRCNQIFGDEEEENPSPATFGCFGRLGEASPIVVFQLRAGETLPLDEGVPPGVHLIIDHRPGSYESGRYVAVEVLEPEVSMGVPAMSFDELVGAYEKPTGEFGFFEITSDGNIVWAADRNDPDKITLTARFDGATVVITDPDCGQDVEGRYEFLTVEDGGIDVVLVDDSCPGRAGLIPGHYEPLG